MSASAAIVTPSLPDGLMDRLAVLMPGARVVAWQPLGEPVAHTDPTLKAAGYGAPIRLTVADADGGQHVLVFRTATANEFGHNRRSDRAAEMLLAHDTFGALPQHVRALDVGAVATDGRLLSLREGGEFYLITSYAPGQLYADDLARIAREGRLGRHDQARTEALAEYLARLHAARLRDDVAWRRAVRDLVGSGEGIFGLIDAYDDDVPEAPPIRLAAIESACLGWRRKLRRRTWRLTRTHGDFHPFNLVFERDAVFTALDASRGACGDPADDVTCLSINYILFALDAPRSWPALRALWRRFWEVYLARSGDGELLEVAAPFLAWRALVLSCPRWYPRLSPAGRNRLLGLAERALAAPAFDPKWAEEIFG